MIYYSGVDGYFKTKGKKMPFVTVVQNPDSPFRHDPVKMEEMCKAAWVSMRERSDAGPFEADDVGGVMSFVNDMTGRPGNCVLRFYYAEQPDRGLDFRMALFEELRSRLPYGIVIIPTPAEHWFTDPTWAVKTVEIQPGMATEGK